MNFYFNDDVNEEIPLTDKDMPKLWAAMLIETLNMWLETEHECFIWYGRWAV